MEMIGKATVPGAFLCDFIPASKLCCIIRNASYTDMTILVKYLPSWVSFQREARKGRDVIESLVTKPFEHVKQEMVGDISYLIKIQRIF